MVPFPGSVEHGRPNLSSPSPHPYVGVGMVVMLKHGVPSQTGMIHPGTPPRSFYVREVQSQSRVEAPAFSWPLHSPFGTRRRDGS